MSIDALIERLNAYSEAGADVVVLDGWKTLAQVAHATDRIPGGKLLKFPKGSGILYPAVEQAPRGAASSEMSR